MLVPSTLGKSMGLLRFFNQIHGTSRGVRLEKGDFLLKHERKVECWKASYFQDGESKPIYMEPEHHLFEQQNPSKPPCSGSSNA